MSQSDIRILFGGLEESPSRGGTIILRGVIDPASLQGIQFADYQRELAPIASRESIFQALKCGEQLPDVELGMRGQRFREAKKNDEYLLQDPVFAIDGKQRIGTAIEYASLHPQSVVRIGAVIHFDTTEQWERERFHKLNATQRKVSPNVLLRNLRDQCRPLMMLYALTEQRGFVLQGRVSWKQAMTRDELITALLYVKMVCALHSAFGPGLSNAIKEILASLITLEHAVTLPVMRDNTAVYFNLVDECFGVRTIQYRACATHLRGTFLKAFARLLANHTDFWRGEDNKRLFIEADLRKKIRAFPLSDKEWQRLAGSAGQAEEMLYQLMISFINSGKRTKRLTPRVAETLSTATKKKIEREITVAHAAA